MSISKFHIAKLSGEFARKMFEYLQYELDEKSDEFNFFCSEFTKELNKGLVFDYIMIWDNISVGGDQCSYTLNLLSKISTNYSYLTKGSWRIVYGYKSNNVYSLITPQRPKTSIHNLIYTHLIKSDPLKKSELVICIEEVVGSTILDEEIIHIQKKFIDIIGKPPDTTQPKNP